MSALRKLGVCYLVSASAFAMAATFAAHPDLARDLNTRIWSPAADFARRQDMTFFDAPYVSARIDLPPEEPVARLTLAPPPEGIAAAPVQSLILPDLTPLPAPAMPEVAAPDAPAVSPPRFAIAPSDVPSNTARNESPPPAAARIAQARLEDSLSPEMRAHFDLFLYVSKAERGPVAIDAIKKHKAAYLMAVGGAAYLVSKAIRGSKVLAFEDLGMEAIYEFDVQDMPVTVAVDSSGTSVHQTGPKEWQAKIGKIPVATA